MPNICGNILYVLKKNSLTFVSYSVPDLRRRCRCRRWLWLLRLPLCLLSVHLSQWWKHPAGSSRMVNFDPSQQACLSGPARRVYVYEMPLQKREWMTRSDIWPLKLPRINGLNRQTLLEGCGLVIRTFTNHIASIYLPFWIHALLQPELPDVHPLVENGTLVSCHRGREDSSTKNHFCLETPLVVCLQRTTFFSQGHIWWSELLWFSGEDRLTGGVTVDRKVGRWEI